MGNIPFGAASSGPPEEQEPSSSSLAGTKRSLDNVDSDSSEKAAGQPSTTTLSASKNKMKLMSSPLLEEDDGAACTASWPKNEEDEKQQEETPEERPAKRARRESSTNDDQKIGFNNDQEQQQMSSQDVWRLAAPINHRESINKVEEVASCVTIEDDEDEEDDDIQVDEEETKMPATTTHADELEEAPRDSSTGEPSEPRTRSAAAAASKTTNKTHDIGDDKNDAEKAIRVGSRRSSRVRRPSTSHMLLPQYETPKKAPKRAVTKGSRSSRKKTPAKTTNTEAKSTNKRTPKKTKQKKTKTAELESSGEPNNESDVWERVRHIQDTKNSSILCRMHGCGSKAVVVWKLQSSKAGDDDWPLCAQCEKLEFNEFLSEAEAEEKDEEKKRVMSMIPAAVKERFGRVGFGAWQQGKSQTKTKSLRFMPSVCVSPYQVPPGAARDAWMKEFTKVTSGKAIDEQRFPVLLYLYGENGKYCVVSMSCFISYQEAPKELEQYATEAERKRDQGLQLTAADKQRIKAMDELKDDLEKYATKDGEKRLDLPDVL